MDGCCLRFVCDYGRNGGRLAFDRPYFRRHARQSLQKPLIAQDIETIAPATFDARISQKTFATAKHWPQKPAIQGETGETGNAF